MKNFRCYNTETIFEVDELTCIIGKNDIGKSTMLEALDAFFNDNIDSGDLSSNGDSNTIEITCCFSGIPENIILDTSVETSPVEEGVLNSNNQLEIIGKSVLDQPIYKYQIGTGKTKILENIVEEAIKNGAEELYDHLKDNLEHNNEADNKSYRKIKKKLKMPKVQMVTASE